MKSPIIIYDNLARTAVGTSKGDLADFYACWTAAFTKHSDRIAAAFAKLETVTKCTANEKLATKEYIKDLTSQRWFWERVFDIYLWKKGGG